MKLTEYADALNTCIKLTYHPNCAHSWSASLDRFRLRENNTVELSNGLGQTPGEALENLAKRISGKEAYIDWSGQSGKEVLVPKNITTLE